MPLLVIVSIVMVIFVLVWHICYPESVGRTLLFKECDRFPDILLTIIVWAYHIVPVVTLFVYLLG